MASDTEITKVRIVIRHLLWQIREVRNDRDAAWEWVNRFANTLQYQDLEQDPDQYALAILAEARSFNDQKKRNGQMKWVREQLAKEGVTSPTQEQLDEKWLEMYGQENSPQDAPNGNASKSPTSCDQFTADAPAREDGEFHDNLESATSANNSGNGGSGTSQARESRRTGADSLRSDCHSALVRLPSFDEFTQFVDAQGLDYTDAREWWEMTMVDRDGHDRDGKPIRNWKITCRRFCEAKANKRKTAK